MAASAYVGTDTVTASSSTWTTFPSLVDTIDTDSYATGGSTITIPADGVYLVCAWVGVAVNATNQRGIRIILNGSTSVPCGVLSSGIAEDANNGRGTYTWYTIPLRSSDTIEFQGWHNHASSQVIDVQILILRLPTTNIWCGNHTEPNVTCSSNNTLFQLPLAPRPVNEGGWTTSGDTLTVPTTGEYLIMARADYDNLGYKAFWVDVKVNGTSIGINIEASRTAGHNHIVRTLSAGDDITYYAAKNDGGVAASVPLQNCSLMLVQVGSCVSLSSTGMTVPNIGYGICGFDGEYVDTDSFHSNVTNNSRITIPSGKDGLYLFGSKLQSPSNLKDGYALFTVNTVADPFWYLCSTFANGADWLGKLAILDTNVSDYIEAGFQSDSGGASSGTPEFFGVHVDGFTYDTFSWRPWYDCPFKSGGFIPKIVRIN